MQMKIAPPQRCANVATAEILSAGTQLDQHVGLLAGPRLCDHLGRLGSDPGQALPAVGAAVPVAGFLVQRLDDIGGLAVGHHPPGVFPRTVLVVRDLA